MGARPAVRRADSQARIIMPLLRTLRTVRHLKPEQVVGQVRNRLRPFWERPGRFATRKAPEFPGCRWAPDRRFLAPGPQQNQPEPIKTGLFAFLNREQELGWPPMDWNVANLPKLWQYNLHYFEWLWALDYEMAKVAVLGWIERHPLAAGAVGWEPYPTSLRLMNWCGVFFGRLRERTEADREFVASLWRSMFLQAEWLCGHLETYLLGNHLFENGAALAFMGSCFDGAAGRRWLETGLNILEREIPEQILPDGTHFERSPMYHIRITYLLRLLKDTGHEQLCGLVDEPLERTKAALGHLCHPDGGIALFNDSAFGIYNKPADLLDTPSRPASGPWALPDAGYYGWRGDNGDYLICDTGPIGPDYLPGHAHGDLLSFELSLGGQRVIVDSGVYDYEESEMRAYCRSTRAHNTVEISGQDQCEFWGAFRVARRGRPHDVRYQPEPFRLEAWHDGYRRLPGRPVHERRMYMRQQGRVSIRDFVVASVPVAAASRLHLPPHCRVECLKVGTAVVEFSEGTLEIELIKAGVLRKEQAWYCPNFGVKETTVALVIELEGRNIETGLDLISK